MESEVIRAFGFGWVLTVSDSFVVFLVFPGSGGARNQWDFRTEFSDSESCVRLPCVFRSDPAGNVPESAGNRPDLAGFRPDLKGSGGRIHRPG